MDPDWDEDPEAPDESDMDASDDPDLAVCPHCRRLITEETQQCPHCKHYLSQPSALPRPAWIIITAIVAVLLMLLFSLR